MDCVCVYSRDCIGCEIMTEKRFKIKVFSKYNSYSVHSGDYYEVYEKKITDKNMPIEHTIVYGRFTSENEAKQLCDLLNAQHEENLELKHDNKRLVKFIMSKGYNLKDYLDWLKEEVWE